MKPFDDAEKAKLIDIAEARDRREKNVLGYRTADVAELDIDGTLYEVLSRRLNETVTKPSNAVVNASLSIVNGVLELMGRDRALDRSLTYEALATLIIMIAAARWTAVDLVPEALRRRFEACTTCHELEDPTLDTLCGECQSIYKGLHNYVREVRAFSHVEDVSDEAVEAATKAYGASILDDANNDARMRGAVEAAVRVLKAEAATFRPYPVQA